MCRLHAGLMALPRPHEQDLRALRWPEEPERERPLQGVLSAQQARAPAYPG